LHKFKIDSKFLKIYNMQITLYQKAFKNMTKKSGSGGGRKRHNYLRFRVAVGVFCFLIIAGLAIASVKVLAQTWQEPTTPPPGANIAPPIWNQNAAAQTGNFWITGNGKLGGQMDAASYCINGASCITSWPAGGGGSGAPSPEILFTRTSLPLVSSVATMDAQCVTEFGSNYYSASISDLATKTLPEAVPSVGYFLVSDSGYGYGSSGAWSQTFTDVGSKPVACVRKSSTITFTRTTLPLVSSVATMDAQCVTEFGSNYYSASLADLGTRAQPAASGLAKYFLISSAGYGLMGNTTWSQTFTDVGSKPVACVTKAASSGGSGGGISGSGTQNYLSKFTPNGTTLGNSLVFDDGNNVGIGTTSPNAKLTVGAALGGSALSPTLTTNSGSLATYAGGDLVLGSFGFTSSNNESLEIRAVRNVAGTDWQSTGIVIGMSVDNTEMVNNGYIDFDHSGNIGVGTVPAYNLDVLGKINASQGVCIGGNCLTSWSKMTNFSSPANPAGTANTTGVVMGLQALTRNIRPLSSGKLMITVTGTIRNSVAGYGASAELIYSASGLDPANGSGIPGTATAIGVWKNMVASTAAGKDCFTLNGIVSGLTVGNDYWFDVGLKSVTGGTSTISDLDVTIVEL
jgi:hypothetical protein